MYIFKHLFVLNSLWHIPSNTKFLQLKTGLRSIYFLLVSDEEAFNILHSKNKKQNNTEAMWTSVIVEPQIIRCKQVFFRLVQRILLVQYDSQRVHCEIEILNNLNLKLFLSYGRNNYPLFLGRRLLLSITRA